MTPTTPSDPDGDELREVKITLCERCLSGEGGECHTPGCAMWLNRAPDLPLHDKVEPANDVDYERLNDASRFLYDAAMTYGRTRGAEDVTRSLCDAQRRAVLEITAMLLSAVLRGDTIEPGDVVTIARRLVGKAPMSNATVPVMMSLDAQPRGLIKRDNISAAHSACIQGMADLGMTMSL